MFRSKNIPLLSLSLLATIFLFACLRGVPKELEGYRVDYPLKGRWNDDTLKGQNYTNKGFGFSFSIPEGWYVSKQDTDSLSEDNVPLEKDPYALLSIEKIADTSIGRIITITFLADPVFDYKDYWVKDAQAYLFHCRDYMVKQNEEHGYPQYEDMTYAATDSINGKKFSYHDFKVVLDSLDNYYLQRSYSSLFDSILLNVQFCYINENEKEEILQILKKTKWEKK